MKPRGGTWVVKIGGKLVEDRDSREALARSCAALDLAPVLVHGGGEAVTRLQAALGSEPRFVAGRRVTSADDLTLVEMVLSGTVNKTLVRSLEAAGRRAVGLSGCDGGLLRCDLVPGLGRVGKPREVDPIVLRSALESGWVPVVSPVSLGPDAEPVNVNADEVAGAIAAALGATRLLLLSDVEGVRVEEAWQAEIRGETVEELVSAGVATGGMIPKLRAAAGAVARGVSEVRIAGFSGGRLEDVAGTRVVAAMREPAQRVPSPRRAVAADIKGVASA
jgi:acetylglutamate kinase